MPQSSALDVSPTDFTMKVIGVTENGGDKNVKVVIVRL